MPVAPAYAANSGMGGGFGYNGDWWLILILLFAFGGFGGWGNGGFGGFGCADGNLLYPWMNNAQITTNGFQNQALNTAISGLQNSVTSGFGDVQLGIAGINQNLCQTGNGIVQAVNSGFSQAEIADNARQMASMQQAFASQTATAQGFNAVQGQLAQNSSDVKGGLGDIRYTIATEECATRNASATNTRADAVTHRGSSSGLSPRKANGASQQGSRRARRTSRTWPSCGRRHPPTVSGRATGSARAIRCPCTSTTR